MPKETLISIREQANYKKVGLFIDSTFVKQDNLDRLVEFSLVDPSGKSKRVSSHEAIAFFSNSDLTTNQADLLIGKLIEKGNIILFGKGEGFWGIIQVKMDISPKMDTVNRVEFTHYSETPGYGAEIESNEWQEQFLKSSISVDGHSFGLVQSKKKLIEGKNSIDGITGSTATSKSAIELTNKLVNEYKNRSTVTSY